MNSMSKVRFGIIGAGNVGEIHAKSISEIENAELIAAFSPNLEKLKKFAKKFSCDYHTTLQELLLRKDIDAVCILTPSGTHAKIGIEAARYGKHVIVEKPIDVNLDMADALIEECERQSVKLSVISQRRFSDAVKTTKEYVKSGKMGKLNFGGVQVKWYRSQEYYDSRAWRGTWALDGGGALMNQSIHYVDLLQYIVGPIEEVFSYCGTKAHNIEVEDLLVGSLKFKNGALGLVEATTVAYPGLFARLDIYASNGTAVIMDDEIEFLTIKSDKKLKKSVKRKSENCGAASAKISHELHKKQLKDIVDSILNNKKPQVTGVDGRNALAIVIALYESCRTGKPIKVDVMKD